MSKKIIALIIAAAVILVGGFAAAIVLIVFGALHLIDRSDARVCGLAAVRRSPIAVQLVGTPIEQKGLTGGSSSFDNGDLTEHITFSVIGPRGEADVDASGHRSPFVSQLDVKIGRNGNSTVVYSGRFECPELHSKR